MNDFQACDGVNVASLYFLNTTINCVHECDLLGITLSSRVTTYNVIEQEVMQFTIKRKEVISDFKLLPCDIKSKLFTAFCTDANYVILNKDKCIICMSLGEN